MIPLIYSPKRSKGSQSPAWIIGIDHPYSVAKPIREASTSLLPIDLTRHRRPPTARSGTFGGPPAPPRER